MSSSVIVTAKVLLSALSLICLFSIIDSLEVKCSEDNENWCKVSNINGTVEQPNHILITPTQNSDTIIGIELTGNSDSKIPTAFFERFPAVREARIKTGVQSISRNDFKNAGKLIDLNLIGNRLKIIPREGFAYANELELIDLSANEITDIEEYAFSGLTKLHTIIINENNLKIIRNSTFTYIPHLQRLELQKNQIELVEDGAFDIESLQALFLRSNRIKELSENMFVNAPNLEIAYFGSNEITLIGDSFHNFKNLRAISFRNSHLTKVDLNHLVKSNPKLEYIYLEKSGFQFQTLTNPREVFDNKLRCLHLTGNNISNSDILTQLEVFDNLQYLDIAANNITYIDGMETIRQRFPKIVEIIYPGNPLNCSWIRATPFERGLFTIPKYHHDLFKSSDYSTVDGIYCKP